MYYIILLLALSNICFAETFKVFDNNLDVHGYASYTYSTDKHVTYDTHTFTGAVSGILYTDYFNINAQISNNEFNYVRRLLLDIPLYHKHGTQVDFASGRLTNPAGLVNTNIMNSGVDGVVLYPLSTYDPRRYRNLPDIVDGVQLTFKQIITDIDISLRTYYGRQLVDDPDIAVYGSGFSVALHSKSAYGAIFKLSKNTTTLNISFSDSDGIIPSTNPPMYIDYINRHATQQLWFIGYSKIIDNIKLQTEATYRKLNTTTDVVGAYGKVSYNIVDNLSIHGGVSYGTRINETSTLLDGFIGVSNKYNHITTALEYHQIALNNWYFAYNQTPVMDKSVLLLSMTYAF
jgi:hypothetical protein